ncbi:hypothetical protein, partial [Pseudomonas syringae group genomosp. 7]|uniref:hypothetical protein n=1 Tax=Pseudomonas syringae group genomosp. 7 TaxID=251699 RepID=UPI00376FF5A9
DNDADYLRRVDVGRLGGGWGGVVGVLCVWCLFGWGCLVVVVVGFGVVCVFCGGRFACGGLWWTCSFELACCGFGGGGGLWGVGGVCVGCGGVGVVGGG